MNDVDAVEEVQRSMQRSIDLTLSTIASALAVPLSWPYWRSFSYFAESRVAWAVYLTLGFALGVMVFYVFFRALRTLFTHEVPGAHAHEHHGHGHSHGHADGHAHHDGHRDGETEGAL